MEESNLIRVIIVNIDFDGTFVGPMRVWIQEDSIPGLAMSRSFGDKIASTVGVIPLPG